MRLIDADRLKIMFRCIPDKGLRNLLHETVDNEPTAYDVEAVVRELEKEIKRTKTKERQCFIEGNDKLGFCLNGRASAMRFAIEIVRGGRND